jgi:hypothetical protein
LFLAQITTTFPQSYPHFLWITSVTPEIRKPCHNGQGSANHDLINPFTVIAIDAPIREHPAALPYCYPVTVLEWKIGRVIVLSPIAKQELSIFHYYGSSTFLVYLQFYKYFHMDGIGRFPIEGLPNEKPRQIDGVQLIANSLIHSARMLSMRRSGIFLRHSFIVAPLLSLNGTLGISSFCRLSSN